MTGRMVLALLAEAIMSMIRYEYPPDEVKVTRKGVTSKKAHRPDNKSICKILNQLTATIYNDEGKRKKVVLSGVSEESVGIFERL